MMDGISRIQERIKQIRTGVNNISQFKPERLKEFEQMLRETSKVDIQKKQSTQYPYLQKTEPLQEVTFNQKEISNNTTYDKSAIDTAISEASKKFNVAEDLIRAVIKHESAYDVKAISNSGAMGLMQLMPGTASDLGVTDPYDVSQNIFGGTKYLRQMLDRYNGNLDKALAAYNAGPTRVDRSGGVPDIRETRNYINSIKKSLLSGE